MKDLNNRYTEIRCPNIRPHFLFRRCGSLIGAIDTSTPSSSIKRCAICELLFLVSVDEDGCIEIEKIKKKKHISFKKYWRIVRDGNKA